uniref:Uncharacterized protein n=1 Tax=Tanacetum cinerariifolium TaxID=118510 RepID=A0A6L2JA49_TANCI|nr:hypothetical protein [Tanacetum cinerariifolium]
MNQLKVDTLTPELLAGPTYEPMKGFLEVVYKATTDQLDWVNPEGQQYLYNLLKPLPLIPDSRGHRVIPFDHFINNYLEYLRRGTSSRKYTTSVTKTKATDYGHIKWIKDLVPRTMWIQEPVGYGKHALWGISHWRRKRQQFYGFAVNRESARYVYSKSRIIAVIELKIIEWHNYKNLDWITVQRDDDKLYKFKEGDFKRLRIQDIEDMLLLLVQGKLTNLTVEERFAFNVSRRINGTLTDVRTALDDHLKGFEMKYLPKSIWRKSDKYRAAAMIQAIDKMLKTRRIIRSLERFVGGRLERYTKKDMAVLAIRQGQIQKPKSQARGKRKSKRKSNLAYTTKQKIPLPAKKEHPAKDVVGHARQHKISYFLLFVKLMSVGITNNSSGSCQEAFQARPLINGDVLNYAFLASRLQSASLQTKLLRHAGIFDSGPNFDDALCVFHTSMETEIMSNSSEIVAPKLMKKLADIYFTRVANTAKSTFSLSPPQMSLWKSQMEDHTSDWLRVVPISGLGQTMNDKTYLCVLYYWLGTPLFSVSKPFSACSRVFTGDMYGDHPVRRLILGWMGGRDKPLSPADMLLYSWDSGLDVCVDLTGSSPLTQTGMTDFVPGRAVIDAAKRKRVKYEAKCGAIGYGFPPFSFSSLRELEGDAIQFSSTDDDSFSFDKIDYVEASPPDSELVSSKVMEIVIPEVGGIKASNDNPIPFYDPIISGTPSNLTPSGESDFFLEVDAFLVVEDEFTSSQFPKSYLDPEGGMLLFEAFLNDDHSSDFKTKSSSTSLNSLLEETNNFDNSLPEFTTFSKVLFDAEYESDSSDDQSCSDEDVLDKIVLKPLCEEEIILMKIDQHPDNAESDLMESLRTYDSSLPISSKIDSLLEEFTGELTLLKSIPPRIDETDCDFEEDIRLIEKLLYDNSSPRPPEEFVSANSNAASESFSPSSILVKDSDSLIEEIDLFCTPDYPMPPGISFHFDILLFFRSPAKPPDGDTGILNIKMMGDVSDQKDFMHKLMITLAPHQEKSPDLLSHRCGTVKKFNTHRGHLNKCPMLIHGQNNPPLDVLLFHFYPP